MRFAALLALLAGFGTVSSALDLSTVDALREIFFAHEEELWKNVTDQKWNEMSEIGADTELSKKFMRWDEELQSVGPLIRPPIIGSILGHFVEKKLRIVEEKYKEFVEFFRRQATPGNVPDPVKDWVDLAENVLRSVALAVSDLNDLLLHGNLFGDVVQLHHKNSDMCHQQLSPHQQIYFLYNTISLTEFKGYVMMQFSWMLLKIYGRSNIIKEANLTRKLYGQRAAETAEAARHVMETIRRDIHRCDPIRQIKGKTYEEVTELLQGYIENEVDLNPDHTCWQNCAYYKDSEKYGCYKDVCRWQTSQCRGRILNCQFIDSYMTVCPSTMYNSHRRYDWIQYYYGRQLGSVGTCPRPTKKVESWWRWLFWHCSFCMCLCDESSPSSHRYFSLKESVSDAGNNKVVTGLRLKKEARVFHLQVHEGTLRPSGSVTPEDWVPVEAFDPDYNGKIQGRDYHMLTYEKRAIDLNDIESPKGYLMTGVRFQMVRDHLHLEIRSTPFNYTTGRLSPEQSRWISNDITRSQLKLSKPDMPTKYSVHNVDSSNDQYMKFENSDIDADAAQSTVPFVDIQEILPLNGKDLLSGAGIIHRGAKKSGGYVGVKVFTYDHSRHVRSDPPSEFHHNLTDTTAGFLPIVN